MNAHLNSRRKATNLVQIHLRSSRHVYHPSEHVKPPPLRATFEEVKCGAGAALRKQIQDFLSPTENCCPSRPTLMKTLFLHSWRLLVHRSHRVYLHTICVHLHFIIIYWLKLHSQNEIVIDMEMGNITKSSFALRLRVLWLSIWRGLCLFEITLMC